MVSPEEFQSVVILNTLQQILHSDTQVDSSHLLSIQHFHLLIKKDCYIIIIESHSI